MVMVDPKLETLLMVAEVKNYSLAAKKLNLTQPAVSQHISALEKELDIRIFNRSGNIITPTAAGEILITYARRCISLYKELKIKIGDEKRQAKSLTIGITHSSEGNIVPEMIANYAKANNGMNIKIISDSIKNLYDKLSTYDIDLAVVEGKVSGDKFSKILLDTDSLVAVISKDNPLSKKEIINISDLMKEHMILRSSKSATRNLFVAQLESNNMSIDDFNILVEIDNTSAIKDLVKKNIGVSVLPKSVCYAEMKDKSLAILPIENMSMITEINLVFLKTFSSRFVLEDLVSLYQATKAN